MDSAFSLIDVIILCSGGYILYVAYLLKFKGIIREGILLPKGVPVNRCSDKPSYTQEMFPKTVAYGIGVMICGGICLFDDKYHVLNYWYYLIMVIFLALTFWFGMATKKSFAKYWPTNNKGKKS